MTFVKSALQDLLVSVKVGSDTADHHATAFLSESAYGACNWYHSYKASGGSLDAALALFNAVLPEWDWDRSIGGIIMVRTFSLFPPLMFDSKNPIPARALLIATLKALIAECDK